MEHLKLPNVMDFSTADGISIAEKWQQWQQAMWLYIDLCIDDKPEKDKCKAFLYVIGPAGRDIFTALVLNDDKKDKIDVLFKNVRSLKNIASRGKNVTVINLTHAAKEQVSLWINM